MRVRLRNPDRVEEVPGPATVAEVLAALDVNPTTVLVIHDGELVTAGTELPADAEVEIRPVMSGGAEARCFDCRGPAVIEEPRHRSAWCAAHFVEHVERQVRKAIDHRVDGERMFSYGDRILIAVSGGKDSLALWDVLLRLGYRVDGLYVGLGIGGYSNRSERIVREFAAQRIEPRGGVLHVVDLAEEYGYTTLSGSQATGRSTCGVCGLSKRYVFNKVAVDHGYDVMLTGHNLDDEAATLFGNLLRWQDDFLARQRPVLPASGANQVRKCKPLYRLSEREMAAYCVVRGIDYVVEECPLVAGNTGMEHKDVLNEIERDAPGTKAQFLFGFLDRADRFDTERAGPVELHACGDCGMPTTGDTCAFCRQRARILPVLATEGSS
ncbi:MAG: ATP-binding protein [Actinomycetes bacterium]